MRPSLLLLYVAVGILIGLSYALITDGGGDQEPPPDVSVRAVRAGSSGSPDALWLFGAATLRFAPGRPTSGELLNQQGFGSTLGASARVNFFEPSSGAVGYLDATRNKIVRLPPVRIASTAEAKSVQPLAATNNALWLVTGSTAITHLRLSDGSQSVTVLEPADSEAVTQVFATGDTVWAATQSATRATLRRIDAGTGAVTGTAELPGTTGPRAWRTISIVELDGHLVVVGARSFVEVDENTLVVSAPIDVQRTPALDVSAVAAADGYLWLLDRSSAKVLQTNVDGSVETAIAVQGPAGALRLPAGVVAGAGAIWVLAPATKASFGAQVVTRVDSRTGKVVSRFTTPAGLEIGGIAFSTK